MLIPQYPFPTVLFIAANNAPAKIKYFLRHRKITSLHHRSSPALMLEKFLIAIFSHFHFSYQTVVPKLTGMAKLGC